MKEKTKRKLRTFVCLLMIPVFLTGCRIKTTPLGVFAQILEYASASGSNLRDRKQLVTIVSPRHLSFGTGFHTTAADRL